MDFPPLSSNAMPKIRSDSNFSDGKCCLIVFILDVEKNLDRSFYFRPKFSNSFIFCYYNYFCEFFLSADSIHKMLHLYCDEES